MSGIKRLALAVVQKLGGKNANKKLSEEIKCQASKKKK